MSSSLRSPATSSGSVVGGSDIGPLVLRSIDEFLFGPDDAQLPNQLSRQSFIVRFIQSKGLTVKGEELLPWLDNEDSLMRCVHLLKGRPVNGEVGKYTFPELESVEVADYESECVGGGILWSDGREEGYEEVGEYLKEGKFVVTRLNKRTFLMVAGLGIANLVGVMCLGLYLEQNRSSWSGSWAYKSLECYAVGFFLVPAARAGAAMWRNGGVERRNKRRRELKESLG